MRLIPLLKEMCHCSVDVGEVVGISAAARLLRGLDKVAELQLPGLWATVYMYLNMSELGRYPFYTCCVLV